MKSSLCLLQQLRLARNQFFFAIGTKCSPCIVLRCTEPSFCPWLFLPLAAILLSAKLLLTFLRHSCSTLTASRSRQSIFSTATFNFHSTATRWRYAEKMHWQNEIARLECLRRLHFQELKEMNWMKEKSFNCNNVKLFYIQLVGKAHKFRQKVFREFLI